MNLGLNVGLVMLVLVLVALHSVGRRAAVSASSMFLCYFMAASIV